MNENKTYPIILFSEEVNDVLSIGKRLPEEPKQEKLSWILYLISPIGTYFGGSIIYLVFHIISDNILIGIFMFLFGLYIFIYSITGVILLISTHIKNWREKKLWEKKVAEIRIVEDNDEYRQRMMKRFLSRRSTPHILDCNSDECVQKGICEPFFFTKLKDSIEACGGLIYINKKVKIEKIWREKDYKLLCSPQKSTFFFDPQNRLDYLYKEEYYYPDYIIIIQNIFIDVEIDEPYSLNDKTPIHYLGIDDYRNRYLNSCGFEIIRFSEEQIVTNPELCLITIKNTINNIIKCDRNISIPKFDNWRTPCWTKQRAQEMAINDYRKYYLKDKL